MSSIKPTYRGRETTVKALGLEWRVPRWTNNILDDWTVWAKKQLPDPIENCLPHVEALANKEYEVLRDQEMPDDAKEKKLHFLQTQQERITRMALDDANSYLALSSPRAQSVLRNPRGQGHLLYLQLKPVYPDLTAEDALNIVLEIGQQEMDRVMATTMGQMPPQKKTQEVAAKAS